MTDANIFQGAIFHEDAVEVTNGTENNKSNGPQNGNGNVENLWNPLESKSKQVNDKAKPAAHRVRLQSQAQIHVLLCARPNDYLTCYPFKLLTLGVLGSCQRYTCFGIV